MVIVMMMMRPRFTSQHFGATDATNVRLAVVVVAADTGMMIHAVILVPSRRYSPAQLTHGSAGAVA